MQPDIVVAVFHVTLCEHLFAGISKAEGSRGIFNDLSFASGVNGHRGRFGVFVRASMDGASVYACSSRGQWPEQPACAIKASATSLSAVKGGMSNRCVASGVPGMTNEKIAPAAVWLRGRDAPAASWPGTGPAATPATLAPLPLPLPLAANVHVVSIWDYSGRETGVDGEKEVGYMQLTRGAGLVSPSAPSPGREADIFGDYVCVCSEEDDAIRGWVPTALVHGVGRCGARAIPFGL